MSKYLDDLRAEIAEKTKRADYIESVERAYEEGKLIEYCGTNNTYEISKHIYFDSWETGDYRVAPKPPEQRIQEAIKLADAFMPDKPCDFYLFLNKLTDILKGS